MKHNAINRAEDTIKNSVIENMPGTWISLPAQLHSKTYLYSQFIGLIFLIRSCVIIWALFTCLIEGMVLLSLENNKIGASTMFDLQVVKGKTYEDVEKAGNHGALYFCGKLVERKTWKEVNPSDTVLKY